jgi:hypothetical protein
MNRKPHSKKNLHKGRKRNKEMLLTISVFLLNQEELRKQFWNVKSVQYDIANKTVSIGINTTQGKLGTTLSKLRKVSRRLSDYLYDHGLTFRKTKIKFFVDKTEVELERIYNLLQKFEK